MSIRTKKSSRAFRTIGEAASVLDVPQHVLRFWEVKFSQLTPVKRRGGRRYYRPKDIDLLLNIRKLLYQDGYTIKGVQKLLEKRVKNPLNLGEESKGIQKQEVSHKNIISNPINQNLTVAEADQLPPPAHPLHPTAVHKVRAAPLPSPRDPRFAVDHQYTQD